MKTFKTLFLALAALLSFTACSDDMYFSEDTIVGDIITLDQSRVGDKIEIIVGGTRKINIQKAQGNVTATPADEAIVTTSVYKYEHRHPEVYILAKAVGETEILIKDTKGKTATLHVKVVECKDGQSTCFYSLVSGKNSRCMISDDVCHRTISFH